MLQEPARHLPAAALTDALRATLSGATSLPGSDLAVLAAWAIVMLAIAARTFRWE